MCIDFRVCIIAVSIFLIIVALTRYVSLGSMIAVWMVPILFFIFGGLTANSAVFIVFGIVLAAFVTILHIPNIKRLVSGTENKFKFRKKDK